MAAWNTLPIFYPNSDQLDSATDLNRVREAVRLVDGWSYRTEAAFDSATAIDTNTPGYYEAGTTRIWWGAVRFIAGCTTLTIEAYGVRTQAETLKVYLGGSATPGSGTLAGVLTPPASLGSFSQSFSITGYSDGDVIPIEVRLDGTHDTGAGTVYLITDAYLTPVSKSGWVAAPSFATVAAATDPDALNGLCFSCQWLFERMRMVPLLPRLGMWYNLGPFKPTTDPTHVNRPMYYGTVARYYSNSALRLYGVVHSITTAGWNFALYLNGSLAYTSPTYGIGAQVIDLTIPLAAYASLGGRVRVAMLASTVDAGTANPLRRTRWTFGVLHATPDSSGWPYATLPAAFTGPSVSTNADTLRARLASLATIVNAVKSRIDARPEQWGRARALRRHYTRGNGGDEALYLARARPYIWRRSGSELFVKGSDIKLGYGPIQLKVDANDLGWEGYTFQHEESVDAANGVSVYLDSYAGLDYGSAIRVLGDPVYAAEVIG